MNPHCTGLLYLVYNVGDTGATAAYYGTSTPSFLEAGHSSNAPKDRGRGSWGGGVPRAGTPPSPLEVTEAPPSRISGYRNKAAYRPQASFSYSSVLAYRITDQMINLKIS